MSPPTTVGSHSEKGSMDPREENEAPNNPKGKGRWLTRLKDWAVTSEPSTQAFKQHKKHVFKSEGVSRKDPDASLKLNVSPTTIPKDAIKHSGPGPDPEDLVLKRAQEKLMAKRASQSAQSSMTPSMSSHSVTSSAVSARWGVECRVPPRTPESSNYRV